MPKILISDHLLCPITKSLMDDPVKTEDKQVYERKAIEKWLSDNDTNPLSGKKLKNKELTPAVQVKGKIKEFLNQNKICSKKSFFSAIKGGDIGKLNQLNYLDSHIKAKMEDEKTALHYAAEYGFVKIVECLLADGAELEVRSKGATPLHVASNFNQPQILILLLAAGADVNAKFLDGTTALHFAVSQDYIGVVKVLLDTGADVMAPDNEGITPLYCAAARGVPEIINLLLAVPNANINIKSLVGGITPLYASMLYKRYEAVELLLNAGADLDVRSDRGMTPRIHAKLDPKLSSILQQHEAKFSKHPNPINIRNQKTNSSKLMVQIACDIQTLFPDKQEPKYIWYADKPPKLGGVPIKISTEKFSKMIGGNYRYTENFYLNNKVKIEAYKLSDHEYMREELLKIISHPLNDKLVVCYIDSKVGYGVFAREDINIGEIVALYSGEIISKQKNFSTSDYNLDLNPESSLAIDATQCGGIARFFQHLPFNANQTIKESVASLKKNELLLKHYLKLTMAGDMPEGVKKSAISMLKNDILHNGGQDIMKKMFLHGGKEGWQIKYLQFKNRSNLNKIAYSNLSTNFSTIDGKPLAYLWAEKAIKKGEQMGFDYGSSYWSEKQILPCIFDSDGAVFSQENYLYTTIPFKTALLQTEECLPSSKVVKKENELSFMHFFIRLIELSQSIEVIQKDFNSIIDPVNEESELVCSLNSLSKKETFLTEKIRLIENEFKKNMQSLTEDYRNSVSSKKESFVQNMQGTTTEIIAARKEDEFLKLSEKVVSLGQDYKIAFQTLEQDFYAKKNQITQMYEKENLELHNEKEQLQNELEKHKREKLDYNSNLISQVERQKKSLSEMLMAYIQEAEQLNTYILSNTRKEVEEFVLTWQGEVQEINSVLMDLQKDDSKKTRDEALISYLLEAIKTEQSIGELVEEIRSILSKKLILTATLSESSDNTSLSEALIIVGKKIDLIDKDYANDLSLAQKDYDSRLLSGKEKFDNNVQEVMKEIMLATQENEFSKLEELSKKIISLGQAHELAIKDLKQKFSTTKVNLDEIRQKKGTALLEEEARLKGALQEHNKKIEEHIQHVKKLEKNKSKMQKTLIGLHGDHVQQVSKIKAHVAATSEAILKKLGQAGKNTAIFSIGYQDNNVERELSEHPDLGDCIISAPLTTMHLNAIPAKVFDKIPYMENPPGEGGRIQYLSAREFQIKFNCEYTEGVVLKNSKQKNKIAQEDDFASFRAKSAYYRLMNPLESLVVCKMSDELGYGLFTLEDIKMGTIVCIYSGEYDPKTSEHVYSYGSINAAHIGGLARFMQHQPISEKAHQFYLMSCLKDHCLFAVQEDMTENEAKEILCSDKEVESFIQKYKQKVRSHHSWDAYDFESISFINEEVKKEVAQSNVTFETAKINGLDVLLIIAMRDIEKNETIGFSYGLMYWQHPSIKSPPSLFTKAGASLPSNSYRYEHMALTKRVLSSFTSNPFFGSLFVPEPPNVKEIKRKHLNTKQVGVREKQKSYLDADRLNKILTFFKDQNGCIPTPAVALRRASAGLRPSDDRGMDDQKIVLRFLISKVSNINDASPSTGMTALHHAVTCNQIENAKILLESGADPNVLDKENKTSRDYALSSSNEKMKNLFLGYQAPSYGSW